MANCSSVFFVSFSFVKPSMLSIFPPIPPLLLLSNFSEFCIAIVLETALPNLALVPFLEIVILSDR